MCAAVVTVIQFIDWRVDARLRDSFVVDEVLKEVNRYVLFDGRGTVVHDPNDIFDAWIDSISVEQRRDYGDADQVEITIHFKKLVQVEPMLHSYGSGARAIGKRTSMLEWKFDVVSPGSAGPDVLLASRDARYLLQIFR